MARRSPRPPSPTARRRRSRRPRLPPPTTRLRSCAISSSLSPTAYCSGRQTGHRLSCRIPSNPRQALIGIDSSPGFPSEVTPPKGVEMAGWARMVTGDLTPESSKTQPSGCTRAPGLSGRCAFPYHHFSGTSNSKFGRKGQAAGGGRGGVIAGSWCRWSGTCS